MVGHLDILPLTREAFAAFGEVIGIEGREPETINYGQTLKWPRLATLDTLAGGGAAAVHRYRSRPIGLPFEVRVMERHPLGSQAFVPLHERPFLVVVAPPGKRPDAAAIRAFVTDGRQGVNYFKGTWHHFQLTLETAADYLVIDRCGPGLNLEEYSLPEPLRIDFRRRPG